MKHLGLTSETFFIDYRLGILKLKKTKKTARKQNKRCVRIFNLERKNERF